MTEIRNAVCERKCREEELRCKRRCRKQRDHPRSRHPLRKQVLRREMQVQLPRQPETRIELSHLFANTSILHAHHEHRRMFTGRRPSYPRIVSQDSRRVKAGARKSLCPPRQPAPISLEFPAHCHERAQMRSNKPANSPVRCAPSKSRRACAHPGPDATS